MKFAKMPIFIPKNVSFTPESLKKFEPIEDDVLDFIQDPEQFVDALPQPYRMLDKFVTAIFENAWEIITAREAYKMVEASKIRPPLYSTDVQLEVISWIFALIEVISYYVYVNMLLFTV